MVFKKHTVPNPMYVCQYKGHNFDNILQKLFKI